jgi:hypothetical protein
MTFKDDLLSDIEDVFLDTDEFATSAIWTDSESEEHTIAGIFDAAGEQVNMATGLVETTMPQLQCAISSVSGIAKGNKIVINSITYYFLYQRPDGTGMTILYLSEDSP